jgi:AcrR family transcriptional regulator
MARIPSPRRRPPNQLPPGRHGLSRAEVEAHQRARIYAAVAATAAEIGYGDTAVEDILSAAGVSRRTFYDQYRNKEEAFLAAFDDGAERLFGMVTAAIGPHESWVDRVEAGLAAFLDTLAAEPTLAHLCVVGVLAAGPKALARRDAVIKRFEELIREGRDRLPDDVMVPGIAEETIVGGIHEVVYSRLVRGEAAALPALLPDLLHAVLLPFLGPEAARDRYLRLTPRGGASSGPAPSGGSAPR